ncbi:cysteine desulfurase [Leucobacter komagatae]|uniref:Cysteine desulfurase n=1 Tax=Leucobacter komagatae TaxID=55969 RepID=A0A542Y4F9_9MICO|nr:cysteine desulfurase family protein [Leucobacter komagatae]TQL42956.1 cysteine desulfurase [Leucobacter komagatae]
MTGPAYLDHAATSPMSAAVLSAYTRALAEVGNPASTHGHGQRALETLEGARERIAVGVGCDTAELVLTGGGTESINLALKGAFWARQRDAARPVLLVADGEHHATIEAVEWLRDTQGAQLVWLPLDEEGSLSPETLSEALDKAGPDRVALVSFLWANNEIGTVQDVAGLCAVARAAGVPAHVDAVAALGQVEIDFRAVGADYLSVSAHKIGGPVGVGALVVGRRAPLEPLFHGGSQQRGRSGTQDVAGAVGFSAALDEVLLAGGSAPDPDHTAALAALRDRLATGILGIDPTAVYRGATDPARRLPGNAHFTFPGCQGDSLVFLLDAAGVSVSVGSACRAGVAETSHVLLAIGLPEDEAAGALRFTLGSASTAEEIDTLLAALPTALDRARAAGLS